MTKTKTVVPEIPEVASDLAAAFSREGFSLHLVGGWVRDAILGNVHEDLDFATEAPPEKSVEILKKWAGDSSVWVTGIEFGTVGAKKQGRVYEVTTFRREVYRDESRNPEVAFAADIETDISRRDFTMNAMAIRLPGRELIDPFGGLEDLARKRIRTPLRPEVSFSDDPLRMLRALRFVSVFDFKVEPQVLEAISEMKGRLAIVSKERVRDEFTKLMLGTVPSKALDLATSTGLADEFMPELPALRLEQDPIQRHKDVFRHTLAVLDKVCAAEEGEADLILRLGALLHDIGKPKTRRITSEGVNFHHHEVVGAEMAEQRLSELRFPARVIDDVTRLIFLHLRFHTYRLGWTDRAVRRYVRDAGGLFGKLNTLVRADCTTRNPVKARELGRRMDELEERIRELAGREELSRMRPALDGHEIMAHLSIPPGKTVGEALDFLMEIRMDDGEIPKEEAFRRLDEWWEARSEPEAEGKGRC